MKELVSINREIFSPAEAKVSVFDRGFLYGDAIYEVTRSYGKVLFQLEPHIERLMRSAASVGMSIGMSRDELIDEIYWVHGKAEGENAYMRIQISRGSGPIGLDPALAVGTTRVIYLKPLPERNMAHVNQGLDIAISGVTRNVKRALDPNIKSGNYLNNILAIVRSPGVSVQEWIMTDSRGFVTEGTTSNIWFVKDGVLVGVPDESDILFGITRQIVRDLSKSLRIPLQERCFTPNELVGADEVFLTSSTREVMPVKTIDGKEVKTSPGPITQRLLDDYQRVIRDYCQAAEKRLSL
jgi:branched-chain amino acid aminotransferase